MITPARTPDARATLVAYLASKIGTSPRDLVGQMPFEIAAVVRDAKPIGAVLWLNYRTHSIEMSWAGEPGWMTRSNLRGIFAYPFVQLKCWTVIGLVNRSNAHMRSFGERLGFVERCVIPAGPTKHGDIVLYTMTRDACPWLVEPPCGAVAATAPISTGVAVHG